MSLDSDKKAQWIEEAASWSLPQSREFLGHLFNFKKVLIIIILFFIFFIFLLGRIFELQIWHGGEFKLLAEKNRVRVKPIPSERGRIFDRNGKELVQNIPTFSITISPSDIPYNKQESQEMLLKIAKISGADVRSLEEYLRSLAHFRFEEVILKEDISYEQALQILVESVGIPGIGIKAQNKRKYLFYSNSEATTSTPFSLSHILGYQSKLVDSELKELYKFGYLPTDYIGRVGVEATFESFLRGSYGKKYVEVDAFGVEQSVLGEEAPSAGRHIILSIDVDLQNKLEEILLRHLRANKKTRGSAIVVDVSDGSILALVSIPAFNSNMFAYGISSSDFNTLLNNEDKPLFNRAISGMYPPGSTIKPFIAAAALEEEIINRDTSFLSSGGIKIGDKFYPDWKKGGHGVTNVIRGLAESVNTFFFIIGGGHENFVGLGVERINNYLRKFGFGDASGVELSGEAKGFLPTPQWKESLKKEPWFIGDTYNLSIGQGDLLVVPLQIAMATAAIANGGTLYRPLIVKEVLDPVSGERQVVDKSILTSNAIKSYNISIVKAGMKECIKSGSCIGLYIPQITTGGKTGTAQWSKNHLNHAWFTGFAPYSNSKIAITVLIEEGGEGSAAALPVARDFLMWWAQKLKINE